MFCSPRFAALLLAGVAAVAMAQSPPAWFPKAPPLPQPTTGIVRVSSTEELFAAAGKATPGTTILVADGDYPIDRPIVLRSRKDLTIRGASGNPAKVTLRGAGWEAERGDILHIGNCEKITVADLTFADARSYGIKVEAENNPRDVHIYNCRFRNMGVRAIKGSAGQDPTVRAVNGSVRFCHFENSKVPPAEWIFGGDYISAIDMMALENWTFSDNYFRNIKGRSGGARAAIFIWVRSTNIVVERNVILNCDRGIAFGNPGQSTANIEGQPLTYVADSIIRNNCIVGGPDTGMGLWHVDAIKILHNTIWRPERNWSRGIRVGKGTRRALIANNLVHGGITQEGGEADRRDNVLGRLEGYFADILSGDGALTATAKQALKSMRAERLPEVPSDILDRPRQHAATVGAWENAPE